VIDQLDVDHAECAVQKCRDALIVVGRLCHAARMIVCENDVLGTVLHGDLKDTARGNVRRVDRALSHTFARNGTAVIVQHQHIHAFHVLTHQQAGKIPFDLCRGMDRTEGKGVGKATRGDRHEQLDIHGQRASDAGRFRQIVHVRLENSAHHAEATQQAANRCLALTLGASRRDQTGEILSCRIPDVTDALRRLRRTDGRCQRAAFLTTPTAFLEFPNSLILTDQVCLMGKTADKGLSAENIMLRINDTR